MRERESEAKGRGVRYGKVMIVDCGSCEKDLISVGGEFHRRWKKLRKERSESSSLEVRGEWMRPRWLEELVLPVGLILMRLR